MISQRYLTRRILRIGACGAAIWLFATPGMSEPEKTSEKPGKMDRKACGGAYKNAKEAQQANHLREAQALLQSCVKATCSAFVKQECLTRYNQLDNDIPTIVPLVTDDGGAAVVDIQVKVDGEVLATKLDGRALAIDPGNHDVTFSNESGVIATERVLIMQGQRNRTIAVPLHPGKHAAKTLAASVTLPQSGNRPTLEPKAAPERTAPEKPAQHKTAESRAETHEEQADLEMSSPPRRGSAGVLPYILGGAGVAAVGAAALFTVWGRKDNDALAQCSPNCIGSSLTRVRTLYTAADISFGVGLGALGVATYLFATAGSGAKEKAPTKTAYVLDVQPTPSGAFATVSGQF